MDIEHFLKDKAMDFYESRQANTYLVFDEGRFKNGDYFIEGYFSLKHTAVSCSELSNTLAKKFGKGVKHEAEPFILIAQIGKFVDNENKSKISIKDIMWHIEGVVEASIEMIPSRLLLVECYKPVFDKQIYQNLGFKFMRTQERHGDTFYQLYRPI